MSQTTTFFLARHGEAEHNVRHITSSRNDSAIHLTLRGREQIAARAEELRGVLVDVIFHSPLLRTQETAAILAEATGAPMREDGRLHETSYGAWEGKSTPLFFLRHPSLKFRMRTGRSGVEGFSEIERRLASFLDDALGDFAGRTMVVVSHGDELRVLSGLLSGQTLDESLGLGGRRFATGEMMRIEYAQS